jgi:hypothetical protein
MEVMDMNLSITDNEKSALKHALETYLTNLRGEIVKTEKHEWKEELHHEEDMLKEIMGRLN